LIPVDCGGFRLIAVFRQTDRRQSVVAGRQQLYCAVRSRSPNHRQTTTRPKKLQSSVGDGTWNVVSDGAFLTDDGRLFHALGRHGRRASNVLWTIPPAWLCQQSADDVECPEKAPNKIRRRCPMKAAFI